MITYTTGNILTADVEALVNPVNCVGIMGAGLALQFKQSFPGNFNAYAIACKNKEVYLGSVFVFETKQMANLHYIINFPTKNHWRDKSKIEDIEARLITLVAVIRQYNISSIAIPPLGCGLGGLSWAQVKRRIITAMVPLADTQVIIYEPVK